MAGRELGTSISATFGCVKHTMNWGRWMERGRNSLHDPTLPQTFLPSIVEHNPAVM